MGLVYRQPLWWVPGVSWENYDDVVDQLRAGGLVIDSSGIDVGTTLPVRCFEQGGDREKRGWYWLSEIPLAGKDGRISNYIVGSYGIYRGNDSGKQNIKLSPKKVTINAEEREAIRARQLEQSRRMKAKRAHEIQRAADRALFVWGKYIQQGSSKYLERKGVQAHGVRFSPMGNGTFAIPICDSAGRVFGLEIVRENGKRGRQKEYFPKGLDKKGHYFLIGSPSPGGIILVAEGFATGATLHESTGLPVAVAFDAGNLLPVSQALAKAYKGARLLICADDDFATHGNPGIEAAKNAALAVSGRYVAPRFNDAGQIEARARITECVPLPGGRLTAEEQKAAKQRVAALFNELGVEKLTDFNDLAMSPSGGNHLVRSQIDEAIAEAGWKPSTAPLRMEPIKGGGESRRRQAVSVMGLDDAIERFWPIDDGTGKYLWDTWTRKIVHRDQMAALLPAGIRGDDVKRHATWVERGAVYIDQIGFDPTEQDKDVLLNTWRGWPIEPVAGECHLILHLIEYLCSEEKNRHEVVKWLLSWMAYPLQNPGAKMHSAVIMHGPQGTGKSAVFQTLARIYGEYSAVLNQRGLEDKFNADWADSKLFLLAEEVVTRAEMWHIKNELKELVTGEWIRVNPKNVAAYRQRNQINIVYLSNEGQPLPIENDDRRHLVVWTPPQLDEEFFDALWSQIENGGLAAFYDYLLKLDITDFHPRKKPPNTIAKDRLAELGKPSEERFMDEWTCGESDWPFCPCEGRQLYQAYSRWCKENGVRNPRESNQFLGYVNRKVGWSNEPRRLFDSTHYTGDPIRKRIVMPPVQLLEKNNAQQPQDKTSAQWVTDCFFQFKAALEGKSQSFSPKNESEHYASH